uniref:Ig-like domain-containing protein n=1 Tax=Tetraodon nigroviridis TaxID=99883 RepID=H3CPQ9_TETNG
MAGVCACCPSYLVSLVSALVLLLCFIGAEVSSCPHQTDIRKNVGEDVELSCFQGVDVIDIRWTYNSTRIAVFDGLQTVYYELFQNRLYLNPTTFSLTVKNLKLNDSGQFSLVLLAGDPPQQLPTVFFNLRVVEVLTAAVTSTSTWNALNASCTVVLECSSGASGELWYRWSVRNRTTTGPRLTYIIGEEDGDTVFTCTVNNSASEASASKVLTCRNRTEKDEKKAEETEETNALLLLVLGVVITVCVVTVAAGLMLCVCRRRCQRAPIPPPDQTVYADVSPVPPQNEHQPCSLYDSIDYREKPAPQSVYDKIQLRYMRDPEISGRTPTCPTSRDGPKPQPHRVQQ